MRQTLRQQAASTRPSLRVLFAPLLVLSFFPLLASGNDTTSPERRDAAKAQFDRAEKARMELESQTEIKRSLKDYTALVREYKRVYLITPRAAPVPQSINQAAELYRTMGDLFDEKYYQSSIDEYQFLLKQYPTTKFREGALLSIAHIEQDDLHDAVLAQKTYEQFLALHPKSPHAPEVVAILGAMKTANATNGPGAKSAKAKAAPDAPAPTKQATAEKTSPPPDAKPDAKQIAMQFPTAGSAAASGAGARVSQIRTWNADMYTRIVIDVGAQVKYQAARISNPDRIYFDIEGAKISPALLHAPVDVGEGGYLKDVRVAQNHSGVVRVVLEVNRAKDYSVFLLPDPYRLVVDVYGTASAAEQAARAAAPPPGPTTDIPPAKNDVPTKEALAKPAAKAAERVVAESAGIALKDKPADKSAPAKETVVNDSSASAKAPAPAADDAKPALKKTAKPADKTVAKSNTDAAPQSAPDQAKKNAPSETLSAEANTPDLAGPAAPELSASPAKKPFRAKKSAHDQATEMGPPPTPELTRDGQHSLTRALGLKIGRIVIDAGHGGKDTGTIGPSGLMEKDLCLDVALRVGKLIQQKLPSADVVYTRDDDTFIPLEQRTSIANDAHADLFLSIHANSSQDRHARGIETYYLNFTGSSDAMEVASRENALSENGVHDLQDIVQKIAKNEKIEESRDFAGIIQDSLSKRMEGLNHGDRNRGVRKAPFVVLIGANMPSVLAEISFISNPSDEQWLKKPENRQKVADGLYHGIENYLQSTNSLANNQPHPAPGTRAGIVARSGNSQ
ncbi:MAG: N-acetylmuramoyl-L-alanine amidase [Acidobacteriia bacterium]|nr:N-acetylmuramoyl-L-alanine amidase [Terriglobia bacterium]